MLNHPTRFIATGRQRPPPKEVAVAFVGPLIKTNVYIDGFNLYFGALKGTPFKWLDLSAMCQMLLPGRSIGKIRYFTARVIPMQNDRQAPNRQDTYLRALETLPELTAHFGRFSSHPAYAPAFPLTFSSTDGSTRTVRILKTEEKRTDVNLATLLLMDCVDEAFEEAAIISNDSDLLLPIEYAIHRFGKTVGVVNPHRRNKVSQELAKAASWTYREINRSVLAASQFPDVVEHPRGPIAKPSAW